MSQLINSQVFVVERVLSVKSQATYQPIFLMAGGVI